MLSCCSTKVSRGESEFALIYDENHFQNASHEEVYLFFPRIRCPKKHSLANSRLTQSFLVAMLKITQFKALNLWILKSSNTVHQFGGSPAMPKCRTAELNL